MHIELFQSFSFSVPFGLSGAPSDGYRGRVAENSPPGSAVPLSAPLRTSSSGGELLCRVDVVRHHGEIRVPFEVAVTDQAAGGAELRTTEALDFETQDFYSFQIEAISCSGTYAERYVGRIIDFEAIYWVKTLVGGRERERCVVISESISISGAVILWHSLIRLRGKEHVTVAHPCNKSPFFLFSRAYVLVQVEDENEFSPSWKTDSVHASAMEGEEPSPTVPLASVAAEDGDGSRDMGDVCSYSIETEQTLFRVTEKGELFATAPLNYSSSHSHVLSVSASDCAGRRSEAPLIVVVEVRRRCRRGWRGVGSVVSYVPGTGPMPLYPRAELETCAGDRASDLTEEERGCEVEGVRAAVDLETSHIGKGCDRDTYSLWSQRRLCGASEEGVDMLPADKDKSNKDANDNKHVLRDEGHLSDASLTFFDGESGLQAPKEVQDLGDNFPGERFTLATWMRHKGSDDKELDQDKHAKEHIVCRADDHMKNRHHMALFVRNCKLVLLLRQEFKEGEENVFRPAEWR